MLVEFAVENYKSFKEMQYLRLEAANIVSKNPKLDQENVFEAKELKLLKFKGIWGANGSGKSNLVKAMAAMWKIVNRSTADENILESYIQPYLLETSKSQSPSFFQLIFIHGGIQYRYGFEADQNQIHSEWLFVKKKKEIPYFIREGQDIIEYNKKQFSEIAIILKQKNNNELFRSNVLVLSLLNTLNQKVASLVRDCINKKIIILDGSANPPKRELFKLLDEDSTKRKILGLIQSIDAGIIDIRKEKAEKLNVFAKVEVKLFPKIELFRQSESDNQLIGFDMDLAEAEGTKKVFYLSWILIGVLEQGFTLVIDEFDARLHPLLIKKIVGLFNSKENNPQNAQLIIVTHDSNLLDANFTRKDQICFAEKNKNGASELIELAEFRGIRNTASFEKDYLKGKYGGIPYLNGMDNVLID